MAGPVLVRCRAGRFAFLRDIDTKEGSSHLGDSIRLPFNCRRLVFWFGHLPDLGSHSDSARLPMVLSQRLACESAYDCFDGSICFLPIHSERTSPTYEAGRKHRGYLVMFFGLLFFAEEVCSFSLPRAGTTSHGNYDIFGFRLGGYYLFVTVTSVLLAKLILPHPTETSKAESE